MKSGNLSKRGVKNPDSLGDKFVATFSALPFQVAAGYAPSAGIWKFLEKFSCGRHGFQFAVGGRVWKDEPFWHCHGVGHAADFAGCHAGSEAPMLADMSMSTPVASVNTISTVCAQLYPEPRSSIAFFMRSSAFMTIGYIFWGLVAHIRNEFFALDVESGLTNL